MEQIIITTGYLFFLYGAYLFASNFPTDPLVKGVTLMVAGILMIVLGVLLARRRLRPPKHKERGWEFQ